MKAPDICHNNQNLKRQNSRERGTTETEMSHHSASILSLGAFATGRVEDAGRRLKPLPRGETQQNFEKTHWVGLTKIRDLGGQGIPKERGRDLSPVLCWSTLQNIC